MLYSCFHFDGCRKGVCGTMTNIDGLYVVYILKIIHLSCRIDSLSYLWFSHLLLLSKQGLKFDTLPEPYP